VVRGEERASQFAPGVNHRHIEPLHGIVSANPSENGELRFMREAMKGSAAPSISFNCDNMKRGSNLVSALLDLDEIDVYLGRLLREFRHDTTKQLITFMHKAVQEPGWRMSLPCVIERRTLNGKRNDPGSAKYLP
jgi:hypothetical protein